MNFGDPRLVAKYGSWVRVQVAFYDFIFEEATNLCATHLNEELISEWKGQRDFYEDAIAKVDSMYADPEEAWEKFIEAERAD